MLIIGPTAFLRGKEGRADEAGDRGEPNICRGMSHSTRTKSVSKRPKESRSYKEKCPDKEMSTGGAIERGQAHSATLAQ